MESGLYVSLSAQLSLERRLDTVARNVANMNTVGYRSDAVSFSSLVSTAGADPVSFASSGETYISREAGTITQTGNPLDVAVDGEGWLAIQTGNGVAYTRDGRMQMGVDGILRTITGNIVTDAGGAPIALDPVAGTPSIAKDGTISQDGAVAGVLGLFEIPANAKLTRFGNSAVQADMAAVPVVEFTNNGFHQGYVEGSNVNSILEISRLISMTRSFEGANSAIQNLESTRQKAIQTLGDA